MPTRCDTAPNPRFWSPYSLGRCGNFSLAGLGCNISLGNCRHSLLLLASGEYEFHTWRQIFLFSANLFTASHAKKSAQFKSTNNPTKAPGPDPHAPPHGVPPSAPHDSSKNRPHWHDRLTTHVGTVCGADVTQLCRYRIVFRAIRGNRKDHTMRKGTRIQTRNQRQTTRRPKPG